MRIKTLGYSFKEGLKSINRNRVMSIASVTTVAAALFIFGVFIILAANVNRVIGTVQDRFEIAVFVKDNISSLESQRLQSDIKNISGVKSVEFVSKEQALDNFKKQLGNNKDLVSGLEDQNPLPASFIVKVKEPEDITITADLISKMNGVDKINYGDRQTLNKLIKLANVVKGGTLFLMIILGTISLFLISNTIKLTVYARKKEIGIMKYIGATDWFIKWPFFIEGMLLGIFGAVVAAAILTICYNFVNSSFASEQVLFTLVPINQICNGLLLYFCLMGAAIGGLGSMWSIRKFLPQ